MGRTDIGCQFVESFTDWTKFPKIPEILKTQEPSNPVSLFWRRYFSTQIIFNIFPIGVTVLAVALMMRCHFCSTTETAVVKIRGRPFT